MTEAILIEKAQNKGFKTAKFMKPAHILHSAGCPTLIIPEDTQIFYEGGCLFYKVGPNNTNLKDEKGGNWSGMIYDGHKDRWAEIIKAPKESLVGRYIKVLSHSLGGSFREYKKGDYLKVLKDPEGEYSCHSVEHINTLDIKGRVAQGDIELMPEGWTPETEQVPFSVRYGYRLPDKWCIKITVENTDALTNFLIERKNEFNGFNNTWENLLPVSFYFHYPQIGAGVKAASSIKPEYTEITFEDFKKHVITHKEETNQFTNVTLEYYGKSGTTTGTSIKVQRSNLSIRGGVAIRATGIKCTKVKIQVRNGYSPD